MYFAKCTPEGVEITTVEGGKWSARNRNELILLGDILPEGVSLMCSSSLDWPEDVTDDLDIIDVCNLIRGNSIRQDEIDEMLDRRRNEHSST